MAHERKAKSITTARSVMGLRTAELGPQCSGSVAQFGVIPGAEVCGAEGQWLVCD